jgi:hypothetical protein
MRNLIRVLRHMEAKAGESQSERAAAFVRAFKLRQMRMYGQTRRTSLEDSDPHSPSDENARANSRD